MAWSPFRLSLSKYLLQGYWSPGVCQQPRGAAIERNMDERSGYGIDFAFLVFTGRKLGQFSCEHKLVTDQDWQDYETFQKLIHEVPRRGAVQQSSNGYDPARAKLIWHPQLVPLEITQCVVIKEYQVDVQHSIGYWPVDYKQVKPTPRAAYARPEAAEATKPKTADEAEIERLRDTLASKRQANQAAGR